MKLNLGCGPIQPEDWVNVDGSNRAWLASRVSWLDRALTRFGLLSSTEFSERTVWANLLRRFPWPENSIDAIYMGEILEHFTPPEGEHVLRESARVLKRGGVLRVRVPDHAEFWRQYVRDYDAAKASSDGSLDHTRWTRMYFETICTSRPKPWQSMGHFHKWMYDDLSLIAACHAAGFSEAQRKRFHESRIVDVAAVESRDDLIIEATKA